ncbi:hypothetical protein GOV05_02860 [Candidatus Woesearchaeota archaeon]|nr:hypothetical protein [Candidatus Woesearchaeota archaeon]
MADKFEARSAIIGKAGKHDEFESYPIFVNLFDKNDPHKDPDALPKKFLEYKGVHKIIIKDLDINYLLAGKDIVINNLTKIVVEQDGPHVIISGEQK